MWKKFKTKTTSTITPSQPKPAVITVGETTAPDIKAGGKQALLGQSLSLEGKITGSEDLILEGKLKGIVDLKDNAVRLTSHGRVEGDIIARTIGIEGEVVGNLYAAEMVCIHRSGYVQGIVSAPRVIVEDGARLKGSIDVDSLESSSRSDVTRNIGAASQSDEEDVRRRLM